MTTHESENGVAPRDGAFSSGLSVPDFAACLQMGLEPVGLVQGFCAMQWNAVPAWSVMGSNMRSTATPGGYVQNYQCPHGMVSAEHRYWGQNYEQSWIEETWHQGFSNAYARMVDEATARGAHGVVAVVDQVNPLSDTGVIEFHLWGTAVKVRDTGAPTTTPWTTYLAGQRLAKIFEAGYAPVAVVATVSSVRVWAYCVTEYLMRGSATSMWVTNSGPVEVDQIVSARTAARRLVGQSARDQLQGDSLHGVSVVVTDSEVGPGDFLTECQLRGNRVRRFKDFDALALPRATVRLS